MCRAQTLLRAQRRKKPIASASGAAEALPTAEEMRYEGMLDCLRKVHAHGGTAALYRGLQAKALQTVLTAALESAPNER